ncbi:MAG: ATP-binding protein [Caulobacter sp.]|nr:ATP-binding protein [Caulobacter sp.]
MQGATTSISRRFLISVGLLSIVVTTLAFLAAFVAFQRELERREIDYLQDYVTQRANQEERRFTDLAAAQRDAGHALRLRMARLDDAEVNRLFEQLFPLQPDGTRRSRDQAFDGQEADDGDYVYGVGAFIQDGADVGLAERRALVAAYQVVPHFGEALVTKYDNFYFFTPRTRVVMFAPNRPDRLMFYRRTAPSNLDISQEQMTRITLALENSGRGIRCTSLQRLLQDDGGERLATGCVTPVDLNGWQVGAFGSSIDLRGYFLQAIRGTTRGSVNLITTAQGDLIAYPGFATAGKASEAKVAAYEQDMGLRALVQHIRQKSPTRGVVRSPDGRYIVAYGQLRGPGWYFLIRYPAQAVSIAAARSAAWILLLGLIAAAAQGALIMVMARRTIADPLSKLAAFAEAERTASNSPREAGANSALEAIESRPDEIGVLARALKSGREKVDHAMDDLEERVRDRTVELERANQEKSRFLANMSHELRTPLNGVVGVSETLAREQTTVRGRELAELIVSSGRLLEQVLTDILDFSKIEAGELRLEQSPFDVATLVNQICALHAESAAAKSLDLSWRIDDGAAGLWSGDPVRITQTLSNLLSNAVKFTTAGNVRLHVGRRDSGLVFSVSDSGIGFDAETAERLFNRFEQADASITRRFGGTGLGLAICRSLAGLMGGTVRAFSRPGEGSTFMVTLPLERADDVPAQPEDAPATASDVPHDGMRVLLAEDHPTNQRVVRLILEAVGVRLEIVETGAAALERLSGQPYDVILMDMQMPEMDGLTATRRLRERERQTGSRRTPVIMLTANALDEHVRSSLQAGADAHLSKPVRADRLLMTLSEVMGDRPRQVDDKATG